MKKFAIIMALSIIAAIVNAAQPTGLCATRHGGQTFLTWSEDTGQTGESYRIYRSTSPITDVTAMTPVGEVNEYSSRFRENWKNPIDNSGWVLMDADVLTAKNGMPAPGANVPRVVFPPSNYTTLDSDLSDGYIGGVKYKQFPNMLSETTGIFVWTTKETSATDIYYAVTTVSSGGSEETGLSSENNIGPISEIKDNIEAVYFYTADNNESRTRDWYFIWNDYEQFKDNYMGYVTYFALSNDRFTNNGDMPSLSIDGYGSMTLSSGYYANYGITELSQQGNASWYFGWHNSRDYQGCDYPGSYGDLSQPEKGEDMDTTTIYNYRQHQIMETALWARRHFNLDDTHFVVQGPSMGGTGTYGLAITYPDMITAVNAGQGVNQIEVPAWASLPDSTVGWGPTCMWSCYGSPYVKDDGQGGRTGNNAYFIPHDYDDAYADKLNWFADTYNVGQVGNATGGKDVYHLKNVVQVLKENTGKTFPLINGSHSSNDGSVQYGTNGYHFERYMRNSRHCLFYMANTNGHANLTVVECHPFLDYMRKDESRPGFSKLPRRYCYLYNKYQATSAGEDKDIAHPDGNGYYYGYHYGLDIVWGCEDISTLSSGDQLRQLIGDNKIIETANSWEIPIYGFLRDLPGDKDFGDYTVDVTPRNLQSMTVNPGDEFTYQITAIGGAVEDSGTIYADEWGLVTIPDVPVRREGAWAKLTKTGGSQAVDNFLVSAYCDDSEVVLHIDNYKYATLEALSAETGVGISSASWSKTSGPDCQIVSPDSTETEVYFDTAGTYVFTLSATGSDATTGSDSITIEVVEPTIVTRYVNTASTPGGDGTTNATTGEHRAYASLEEWNNAEEGDLVVKKQVMVVKCCGGAADTTRFKLANFWFTNEDYYFVITGNQDHVNGRHNGVWSDSRYRLIVDYADGTYDKGALRLNKPYNIIDGIQVENTNNAGTSVMLSSQSYGTRRTQVRNCIIRGGYVGLRTASDVLGPIFCNNIIYNSYEYGIYCGARNSVVINNTLYNCNISDTSSRYGLFISDKANGSVIKNNLIIDCHGSGGTRKDLNFVSSMFYPGLGDDIEYANNITSDSSGQLANYTASDDSADGGDTCVVFNDLTPGSEDLRLQDLFATQNGALEKGSDLSEYHIITDITGMSRTTTWDVGADEAIDQSLPRVENPSSASVEADTATLGGEITRIGESNINERGVYWSTNENFADGDGTKVSETGDWGATGTYTVNASALPGGTTVYFKAFAANGYGAGYSSRSSFLTKPDAPVLSAASDVLDTGFTASWAASTGADSYDLYVATDAGFTSLLPGYNPKTGISGLSDVVTGLSASTPYWFKVTAVNATGEGPDSNTETVTTSEVMPRVSDVNTTATPGTHASGTITVRVVFDEAVQVTGTPRIALNTTPARYADYTGGTGTTTLSFGYTIQPDDIAARLDYTAITALELNGGTIVKNGGGVAANRTLPAVGTSPLYSTNVEIDAMAPEISFSPADGESNILLGAEITVSFDEAVRNTDTSEITDTNADSLITFKETDAGGADVPFDAVINGGKTVITITPSSDLDPEQDYFVAIAAVEDAHGNETGADSATFTTGSGAWTAYHSLMGSASYNSSKVTAGNGGNYLHPHEFLKYSATDHSLDATLYIMYSNTTETETERTGIAPADGDAKALFDGIITPASGSANSVVFANTSNTASLFFTNLSGKHKYSVALYASANNNAGDTRLTIGGASSYVAAHSAGVTDGGTDADVNDEDIDINVDNSGNGLLARWTNITPVSGEFSVQVAAGDPCIQHYMPVMIQLKQLEGPTVEYFPLAFSEDPANDGASADTVIITISGDTFAADVVSANHVTASNVPAGLTAAFTRVNDNKITLALTGNASAHADANDIANLAVSFDDDAFVTNAAAEVVDSSKNLSVDFNDPATAALAYSDDTFYEAGTNDGAISNTLTISLVNDRFAGDVTSHISVSNYPTGLSPSISRIDDYTVTLTFTGNSSQHDNMHDVSDLTVSFADAAFTYNGAASVTDSTKSDLLIDFSDVMPDYFVSASTGNDTSGDGSQGNPFATIGHAVSVCSGGEAIKVVDAAHTEQGITVSQSVTILGDGSSLTIVQANALANTATDRVFNVTANNVTIKNMTIRHGYITTSDGAGILNEAQNFTLENCVVADNAATGGSGGGLCSYKYNAAVSATLSNCAFTDNAALKLGGGILNGWNGSGTSAMTVVDCTISGNQVTDWNADGGGLACGKNGSGGTGSATMTVSGTTISDNIATNTGGGITLYSASTVTVENSTISGNTANRASDGSGGGVYLTNADDSLTIYNSTITNNSAGDTGTADPGGGGIRVAAGTLNLYSTIVSGNTTGGSLGTDVYGAIAAADHCLFGDSSDFTITSDTNNLKDQDPLLAALTDNGGPTETHEIQAGSPAINTGSNPQTLVNDQRGAGYDRVSDGQADIGAYEVQGGLSPTISYSAAIFNEAAANDGSIDNTTPVTISLTNETFTGSNSDDFVSGGKIIVTNMPAGLTAVATRTSETELSVTITGNAASHEDSDDVSNLTFAFQNSAFTGDDASAVNNATKSDLAIDFDDAPVPAISIADDGSIVEGSENGEIITVTLSNATFAGSLNEINWTVSNLPVGVSKGTVTRVGDTTATIALSGNRTADYDTDITTVTVQCAADEHSGAGVLSDNTGVTLSAVNETVSYSASSLSEAAANDGSIDGSINLDVTGDDFAADVVSGNHVTASNVPAGLSASFVRQSGTRIVFSLTGNAAAHADSDDVSNLAVTFDNDAFATLPLSFISGANRSDLGINFNDPAGAADIYVATTGSDVTGDGTYDNPYATIGKAITEAAGGEVIGVAAGVYTEAGIAVGKEIAIVGSGADVTTVQAHAAYDSASDRVFTVTAAADVTIADMTIRHGRHADNGGGIYMRPAATGTYSYIIDGCEIVDNISNCAVAYNKGGGGLYAFTPAEAGYDLTLIVSDSTVEGNYCASRGGGIYIERGNNSAMAATIENCTIAGNQADGTDTQTGGGIALQNLDNGDIYNCTIAGNTAGGTGGGGGIAFRYGAYDLCNSIVAGNTDTNGDQEDIDRGGGTINESYNVIGINEMGGTDLESGTPNANGSHIGTTGTPVSANLAAIADNGGTTRTMMPTSGAALRLIPRGSEPYYNGSPERDQRGYFISSPIGHDDYNARTCGPYWDAASPTPARGFRGWTR